MSGATWVGAFLDSLAAERDAAANTRLAYGRDLNDFSGWLAHRGVQLSDVSRGDVDAYLLSCEAQGLSKATRARRLSAIRQLFRFAHEEGFREDNPTLRLSGPGKERKLPGTLEVPEIEALIAAARSGAGDRMRNTCLLELLYATGMRVSELVSLPVAAARGDPRVILVRGKGGKERLVPLSPPAREALAEWLGERDAAEEGKSKGAQPSRFLFPSRGVAGHLTRQGFFALLKDLAAQAGIPLDRVTPHRLRHAFATHLLANGADLRSIQAMLGHADLATTEIYTHVLDERLRELVLTKHPLAERNEAE
ncbi:Tyrosine recombinase XerD [Rubellimicrobium mesophilum DSM 19309]|uniref:Tyrosine recombinase XerC n=1 Tax=Rubellimicrobium mesophilum DSM 19309 TaxID=442562 RepID=A0A017HQP1_9RHOB|nr:site-specific tyrosine recombinase XerD [Rubellimicrobium mesophilum]EYD76630.1 Tyrosine recombinase XerD [Rubellimicrobium mesophilum DSM 19309]